MPKQVKLWECKNCRGIHDTEQSAKECEDNHAFIGKVSIVEASRCRPENRYPDGLLVTDGSGDTAEYKLVRIGSVEDFYEEKEYYFDWEEK